MGSATSVEIGNGVADIQKILASTSPRGLDDPVWTELLNKKINSRFWTQVYLQNISAFDAAVQTQVTSPLLALNDSTGNLRTLLRFAARLLYHHRINHHIQPSTCKPEALIELILLMTHVIKGFQEKLSVHELFFHLDQAPLTKQDDARLFLHYWGNTVSMELVPNVAGDILLNHTASSLVSISSTDTFRRLDAPGVLSMKEAGLALESGVRHFAVCPRAVAESGSVNFILQEVVDFLVSTSWGAVGSVAGAGEDPLRSERNKRVPLLDMELHGVLLDFILVLFHTPEIVRYVCEKDCVPLLTTVLNFLWLHSYTHRVLDGSLPGAEHAIEVSAQEYEQSLEIANLVRQRATQVCCVLLWNHPRMSELVAALTDTKADDSSQPKSTGPLHFGPLIAHIVSHVQSPLVVLLLYTLTHHCPVFRRHLQAETDPHAVLIPLIQTLWEYTGESHEQLASDITLLALVLFDLLADTAFQTILQEDIETSTLRLVGIPSLTMPVGSLLVVCISRLARWNFQFFCDEFINELVSGLIGNLRVPIHWYAAEGMVSLLISLGRKLPTKTAAQPLAATLCRAIVGFLRRCLAQRRRGNVGFAIIRKGNALRTVSVFAQDLFDPLLLELDRMEDALSCREDYEFGEAVSILDAMPFSEPPKATTWIYEEQDSSYFLNMCNDKIGRIS